MPDYSILKTKLTDTSFNGLNDVQIMSILNTSQINIKKPIMVIDIEKYLSANRKYIKIIDSSDINAREAVLALQKFTSFDTSNTTYLAVLTSIIDGLISIGLLANQDKTSILSMANDVTTWAQQQWGRDITLTDIANARSYI